MWLSFYIDDKSIDGFLKEQGYQEASLVKILKKEVGFKNGEEIRSKYNLLTSCLREKVCWKNDTEYKEILFKLGRILEGTKTNTIPRHLRGNSITRVWIDSSGKYRFGYPYDNSQRNTLEIHQREYIVKKWLQENF